MPSTSSLPAAARRKTEWSLFLATFIAFAYFHQGGGWSQNVRFAMVRAMVEEGRFSIDSYLIYKGATAGGTTELVRVPVSDAEYRWQGKTYALVWSDVQDHPMLINKNRGNASARDVTFTNLEQIGATGDVAFERGHFHPNKAPGTSFIAVPAYFFIYYLGKLFGSNPDSWWRLTCNAWLTSVFSVGLLSALGCVLLYRLSLAWGGSAAVSLIVTLAFAFGTMFFSYATMLYEHNIIAVALIASFYFLYRVKEASAREGGSGEGLSDGRVRLYVFLSGLAAGYAAITNYIIALLVVLLGLYLIWSVRRKRGWYWFGLGVLGPFLLICAYNSICFGTPFTTNYRHQNPLFRTGAFLDVFILPRWEVLVAILVSPFRGLFWSSPVLVLGMAGLGCLFRQRRLRAEAWLLSSIVLFILLFSTSFKEWHGGWATAPRYLAPALPFFALPMVFVIARFIKTAVALAVISAAITLLTVAVDPQSCLGTGTPGTVPTRPGVRERPLAASFAYDPLIEYVLPIFFTGRAEPIMRAQVQATLDQLEGTLAANGVSPNARSDQLEVLRRELDLAIRGGDPDRLLPLRSAAGQVSAGQLFQLLGLRGPVSANAMGMYESWFYQAYQPYSQQADWNSFDVGEFVFPRSRMSLLPLLVLCGGLVALSVRFAQAAAVSHRIPKASKIQKH